MYACVCVLYVYVSSLVLSVVCLCPYAQVDYAGCKPAAHVEATAIFTSRRALCWQPERAKDSTRAAGRPSHRSLCSLHHLVLKGVTSLPGSSDCRQQEKFAPRLLSLL